MKGSPSRMSSIRIAEARLILHRTASGKLGNASANGYALRLQP
jgi:hypothetical protein